MTKIISQEPEYWSVNKTHFVLKIIVKTVIFRTLLFDGRIMFLMLYCIVWTSWICYFSMCCFLYQSKNTIPSNRSIHSIIIYMLNLLKKFIKSYMKTRLC